jgi:hypothetical protein
MRINEHISVELLASGAPIRFTWRGVVYGVVSAPEPWITRRPWWVESSHVAKGSGNIDLPVWRVDALPLTDGAQRMDGTFDLCYERDLRRWTLMNAYSDELDERLFA